ncbi:hypothetical protein [Halolamina salifodinae]|uniref:GIY-YIG domain-containing protein n=1 Tax=Halolamina salifodinae TaxID=1202767 RepID=A0A8T4H3B8_9EURY|nr:hypothetical protein [Halolamina salifodinae]MBP1988125.1 hypothetical protein [Halolamina salifodinae]
MARADDLDRFYDVLERLDRRVGGARRLKNCTGHMDWPDRGVYAFLEPGQYHEDGVRRVTRVGTHAVSAGSSTTLWDRLKQHSGTGDGSDAHPHGGNHRGSVYRKRVGEAIIENHDLHTEYPDWGERWSTVDRDRTVVRDEEYLLERRVSTYLREQPFLWMDLDDEPGPKSDRAVLERSVIALVSNAGREPIDPRPVDWLGRHSPSAAIRDSGLWNVAGVEDDYDPAALDLLETAVDATTPP